MRPLWMVIALLFLGGCAIEIDETDRSRAPENEQEQFDENTVEPPPGPRGGVEEVTHEMECGSQVIRLPRVDGDGWDELIIPIECVMVPLMNIGDPYLVDV